MNSTNQEISWKYEGIEVKSLEDLPVGTTGFVYIISYTDGTYYIGKRDIYSTKNLQLRKSGIPRPNSEPVGKNKGGKRVYYDRVKKENNWMEYTGSSKATEGLVVKSKRIIEVAYSNRYLTYIEAKILFMTEVLEKDIYRNENILGRFYKGNIV